MPAAATDLLQEVGINTATTLDAPGYTISDTSITVVSTSNWPTATGITFAMDTIDANGDQVAGSYNEYVGVVASATSITNVSHQNGTDQNYSAGTTTRVYIPVSAERENRIVEWGLVHADQDGTLKAGAVDVTAVLADDVVTPAKWTNPYCFRVYHNATQNVTTAGATVAFNTESYDVNNNFASNTYTVPVSGIYHFDAQTAWAATGSQTRCVLYLSINGSDSAGIVIGDVSTGAAAFGINGSVDVQLTAANTITIFFLPVGATTTLRAGGADTASTWFSGHLVRQT